MFSSHAGGLVTAVLTNMLISHQFQHLHLYRKVCWTVLLWTCNLGETASDSLQTKAAKRCWKMTDVAWRGGACL
jgi:hypothetical protein